jgi:hypothetical protein
MDYVTERSTAYIAVDFLDKDGEPVAPTSISYRIEDVETGTVVKADTAVAPPAGSVEITVAPAENRLLPGASYHRRRVTITAEYGVGDQVTTEYVYEVRALAGVPD